MTNFPLRSEYLKIKSLTTRDAQNAEVGEAILEFAIASHNFLLAECEQVELVSRVHGKDYFTFAARHVIGRSVNKRLFVNEPSLIIKLWREWLTNHIAPEDFAKLSYTIVLAPCLVMELFDRQNKKGPATYFEHYIGHLFAKALGTNPTKRVRLPIGDRSVLMTMDFLFDVKGQRRKLHLPVKLSTRERVVQAWAHQRLLDAAYGQNIYQGIMVLFSETKLDSRSREVVEICVPDQWLAYQTLLAKMDRIYYFDLPERYRILASSYPEMITIKQFGEFFSEREEVLRA